ncbi:MAG: ATP-dependent helicase HrpB [Caulobacteraceae bacterium]|nr:ATP-dependent helicase HrpB [Caulobacter sp.]
MTLPIHDALPALRAALRQGSNAVLVAPPGAGKSTAVPLALMDEPWARGGKLIVLEPRRLAARAAAARMAQMLGEAVGGTVGFRVRLQSRVSAATRVEVVTEGVFTRMILDDPALEGVAAVLFDEAHERALDGDLGLAFALDAQGLLRPDLRLLAMSATLDGAALSRLMGEAPVIESLGRAFPVETRYVGRDPVLRLEDDVARAVRRALAEEAGGVLAFLPGQGEIRRCAERLAETVRDPAVEIAPLYGALDPAEQDRAVRPAPPGRRKVVLATSIAETSLTLEGVRVVVDGGFARAPRYDPASGLTRLETVRVSRAAADQRRGRAGRTAPGVCHRLWDEAQTRGLVPFAAPEIAESDLSGVALALAAWGARDAGELRFLDPPPAGAFAEARRLLLDLGALDGEGGLTPHGRRMAGFGLPPRLAHMVLEGARLGAGSRAAGIAALLGERGLGGADADVSERLRRLEGERGPRAADARRLADRWSRAAGGGAAGVEPPSDGRLLALAYPERVARARGAPGEYRLASGRGAALDPADALARSPWLAVGELAGGGVRDRIVTAAALDEAEVRAAFADRIVVEEAVEVDGQGRVEARRVSRLGRLVVEERRLDRPDPGRVAQAWLARVRAHGLDALPWGDAAAALRARNAFMRRLEPDAGWPDLSDAALLEGGEAWLLPLLAGLPRLDALAPADLHAALLALIPWELQRRLDRDAPARLHTPAGAGAEIDYAAEGGPQAQVRVQELFGLAEHPMLAGGREPLTLALLSPARRPVQVTRDLPGFWRGSWREVRTEMKGRYPRHPWPENALTAPPTTRAKPRGT